MKSVQITYDAKVKIGTSYERGEACTQLDFLDDKVVESLIADLNAALLNRVRTGSICFRRLLL